MGHRHRSPVWKSWVCPPPPLVVLTLLTFKCITCSACIHYYLLRCKISTFVRLPGFKRRKLPTFFPGDQADLAENKLDRHLVSYSTSSHSFKGMYTCELQKHCSYFFQYTILHFIGLRLKLHTTHYAMSCWVRVILARLVDSERVVVRFYWQLHFFQHYLQEMLPAGRVYSV